MVETVVAFVETVVVIVVETVVAIVVETEVAIKVETEVTIVVETEVATTPHPPHSHAPLWLQLRFPLAQQPYVPVCRGVDFTLTHEA